MPKTQLVLNAGATSKMLNKVNETNDLRKNDNLIKRENTKLIRSTRGLYNKNNNKLTGLFDIVRLNNKMKKEEARRKKLMELGLGSSYTLNTSMGSP